MAGKEQHQTIFLWHLNTAARVKERPFSIVKAFKAIPSAFKACQGVGKNTKLLLTQKHSQAKAFFRIESLFLWCLFLVDLGDRGEIKRESILASFA